MELFCLQVAKKYQSMQLEEVAHQVVFSIQSLVWQHGRPRLVLPAGAQAACIWETRVMLTQDCSVGQIQASWSKRDDTSSYLNDRVVPNTSTAVGQVYETLWCIATLLRSQSVYERSWSFTASLTWAVETGLQGCSPEISRVLPKMLLTVSTGVNS